MGRLKLLWTASGRSATTPIVPNLALISSRLGALAEAQAFVAATATMHSVTKTTGRDARPATGFPLTQDESSEEPTGRDKGVTDLGPAAAVLAVLSCLFIGPSTARTLGGDVASRVA